MSLRIGRVTGLPEPTEPPGWTNNVDGSVTVVGNYRATSVTDGLVKRDQLLGYMDNWDEPIVPVVMDNEPRVTGYYRVIDVSFSTDQFTRVRGNLYNYSVTLLPIQGFAQPLCESVLSGALLSNNVGAVLSDTIFFHGVPAIVTEYGRDQTLTSSTRSSADGNMTIWRKSGGLGQGTGSFALTPPNFYIGACTFEQGSPLQPVVGRELVQPDVINWRLSNGLVRVTPNAITGKLDISHWKGAAWATPKTYKITGTAAGLYNGFTSLTVLRNSVEEVAIRLGLTYPGTYVGRVTLDLAIRRGDGLVRGFIVSDATDQWAFARDTVEAATAITYGAVTLGGIRATSNDADSNRYILLCYQTIAPTNDLVNGKITTPGSIKGADVAFGSEIAGSAAVAPDDAVSVAKEYIAALTESQRVVPR